MKKLLILLGIALFGLNSYGQYAQTIIQSDTTQISKSKLLKKKNNTETYIVEYDFKTGLYSESLLRPKVDRPIVFKIKNINRLAFKVNVNHSDGVFAQTDWFTNINDLKKVTSLIKDDAPVDQIKAEESLKFKEYEIDPKALKKNDLVKDLENLQKTDSLNLELQQKIKDLVKVESNKISLSDYQLEGDNNESYELVKKIYNAELAKADLKKLSIEDDIKKLQNSILRIESIKNEKLSDFQSAKENFKTAYNEINGSYSKLNTITQAAVRVISISYLPYLNKIDFDKQYKDEFKKELLELQSSEITEMTINEQYANLIRTYNDIVDLQGMEELLGKNSYQNYINSVQLLVENGKKIKFKSELIDFEKLLKHVQNTIHLLERDETYEYVSAPIQPKNDVAIFDVEIIANNNDAEVNNSRKFTHSEFVRRGTRIDFSIGLAGSYFDNANVYEIYTKDSVNKIGVKNKHLTAPCLVTMITMTNRSSKYCAFGGSAGLGIDVINGKIQMSNFFLGPTLILGKYDRMMLTAGFTLRNVGKLKGEYIEDSIITQTTDINSVLSDNYRIGQFVALTYNLTDNVREKIKKY